MKYAYPVAIVYEPDDHPDSPDYLVYVPDFIDDPATQGRDLVDSLATAEDWLFLMIDEYIKNKTPLPPISTVQSVQKKYPKATVSLALVE